MNLFNQGAAGLEGGFPQMLQQIMQMAQGGNEDMWGKIEAPALRQFGQLQGDIASRFSGAGMGARKGSGFQNTMGGAAADLSERLQANRMGLQNRAQDQLMGLYQNLMGQDLSTNQLIEKKKSPWMALLEALGGAAGNAAGTFGGMGASKAAGFLK